MHAERSFQLIIQLKTILSAGLSLDQPGELIAIPVFDLLFVADFLHTSSSHNSLHCICWWHNFKFLLKQLTLMYYCWIFQLCQLVLVQINKKNLTKTKEFLFFVNRQWDLILPDSITNVERVDEFWLLGYLLLPVFLWANVDFYFINFVT